MLTCKKSSICIGFSGFCLMKNQRHFSKFAPPQKFGVDFGKFGQLALKFQMRGDASAGAFALFGRFEQKLAHPAGSKALNQIIKWAMLESPAATAVRFAARQILLDV
jgi:hypothetical protein